MFIGVYTMTPTEIKIAIAKAGFTQLDIAKALDANPSTISSVINDRYVSKKIALAICKVINKTPEVVFPNNEKYHANYNPNAESDQRVIELRQLLAS